MGAVEQANAAPTEVPTGADLGAIEAVWHALRNKSIDFYPRIVANGEAQSLDSAAVLAEAGTASANWSSVAAGDDLDAAIKFARESLTEVSKQTEYQDQKATRLLTVTTFLSAFAGVLFTRFQDSYPMSALRFDVSSGIVLLTYLFFVAFIVTALLGALVVFHATRTRFKYPAHDKISTSESPPKSLLFYTGIIRARPHAWMNDWATIPASGTGAVRSDLRQRYFQNLVSETYLVAAKTADKLRYLQPAQHLLSQALKWLLAWLAILCITSVVVGPTKPSPGPLQVQLSEPVALPPPTVVVQAPASTTPPAAADAPR